MGNLRRSEVSTKEYDTLFRTILTQAFSAKPGDGGASKPTPSQDSPKCEPSERVLFVIRRQESRIERHAYE